jgi:hypothetical protein
MMSRTLINQTGGTNLDTIALDPRLRHSTEFLGRRLGMLIGGKLVPAASGKTFPVYNPATGTVIANVPEGEKADVDLAVAAARRAFDDGVWAKIGPSGRGKMLWKMAEVIEKNLEELAELESVDNGKPYAVARVADLPLAVDMFRYNGGLGDEDHRFHAAAFAAGRVFVVHGARTHRGGRPNHPVELSAADGGLEAGAGVGGGLHRGAEGCRANPDDRIAAGGTVSGGRLPAGRGQHPDRIWRDCRSGDRGPS